MTALRPPREAFSPRRRSQPASKQRLRLWLRLLRTCRTIEGELRERLRVGLEWRVPGPLMAVSTPQAVQSMGATAWRAWCVLMASIAPDVVVAQRAQEPVAAQPTVTAERSAAVNEHVSNWLRTCLQDWDAATHMTRGEWRATCQRVADERRTFLLENSDVAPKSFQSGAPR